MHFTNTHLSKEIFQKAQQDKLYDGMTEDQLRDYQMWTMEDLENYLLSTVNNHFLKKFFNRF